MEEPFRLLRWQGKPQDANKLALAPGPELTNVAQQPHGSSPWQIQ